MLAAAFFNTVQMAFLFEGSLCYANVFMLHVYWILFIVDVEIACVFFGTKH